MSKFFSFLVCFVVAIVLLLSGCTGPAGSAGLPGPAGPPGSAGPPGPAGSAAEITPATLVIVPMSGEAKTKLTFYGSGFVSGEEVRVIITINGVPCAFGPAGSEEASTGGGMAIANEQGAFKLESKGGIPIMIEPGVYTVEAIGDKGSRATAPLEVLEKE